MMNVTRCALEIAERILRDARPGQRTSVTIDSPGLRSRVLKRIYTAEKLQDGSVQVDRQPNERTRPR